ncbi:MAG TPA: hypothetical protein VNO70_21080 [Blastocatellia bacterium]|nr:hypothetical protein [Blastocatellia bacterium]
MSQRRALILDLDSTLLHLDVTPGAIEVPGRTRSAYVSAETVYALAALQDKYDIVLATARSWLGTQPVVAGLAERGVRVTGVVLEDGGLLGPPGAHRPLEPRRQWGALRSVIETTITDGLPQFQWQEDFQACLVARAESAAEAQALEPLLGRRAREIDATLRSFRDGRKVYLAGERADKWTALETLLSERAREAVGIGDGANDACWLAHVALPCTLTGAAPELVALVGGRGGLLSEAAGHMGICELLNLLADPSPIKS